MLNPHHEIARKAIEMWEGDPASLQHVSDSTNYIFSFMASGERRYLRLISSDDRTREQIEAELDFITYLGGRGIGVSLPLRSSHGRSIETFRVSAVSYFACVFREAPGEPFTFDSHAANLKHFRLRGRTLGRIHTLSKTYTPPRDRRRFRWDEDDCIRNAARYVPESEKAVWAEYRQLTAWLRSYPRTRDSFGLIHGDFGATNYRHQDDHLTIFDFDDCCYHWYAYDLAIVIYPHGWRKEATALLNALLEGYAEEAGSPLPAKVDLINFCRLRLLYMFLIHAKKWGFADLSDQQAKWFARKRDNIVRGYAFHASTRRSV